MASIFIDGHRGVWRAIWSRTSPSYYRGARISLALVDDYLRRRAGCQYVEPFMRESRRPLRQRFGGTFVVEGNDPHTDINARSIRSTHVHRIDYRQWHLGSQCLFTQYPQRVQAGAVADVEMAGFRRASDVNVSVTCHAVFQARVNRQ